MLSGHAHVLRGTELRGSAGIAGLIAGVFASLTANLTDFVAHANFLNCAVAICTCTGRFSSLSKIIDRSSPVCAW
jgi:hypothetical protein